VESRSRVLVASQPAAWRRLQPMLEPLVDALPVHTTEAAFRALDHDGIDLILCTVAFDDSRMIDFLQAVKRKVPAGAIPFVCTRLLPGVLNDNLVENTRTVCLQCGAAAFVDVAKDQEKAPMVIREVLLTHLPRKSPR
jgi:DNA-binding NarL/FixJ family response regulator